MSGVRVGCHVNIAESFIFVKYVCAYFVWMMKISVFVVIQLQHVGFYPLTDTGNTQFYFPDGNIG